MIGPVAAEVDRIRDPEISTGQKSASAVTRGYACICTPRPGQNINSVVFADSPVDNFPPEL